MREEVWIYIPPAESLLILREIYSKRVFDGPLNEKTICWVALKVPFAVFIPLGNHHFTDGFVHDLSSYILITYSECFVNLLMLQCKELSLTVPSAQSVGEQSVSDLITFYVTSFNQHQCCWYKLHVWIGLPSIHELDKISCKRSYSGGNHKEARGVDRTINVSEVDHLIVRLWSWYVLVLLQHLDQGVVKRS